MLGLFRSREDRHSAWRMYGLSIVDKCFEIGGLTYCLIISSGFDGREKLTEETKFVGSRYCLTPGD